LYIEYSEQELCLAQSMTCAILLYFAVNANPRFLRCTIIERGSLKTAIRQVYASQLA
jgi:hypothetical protein